MEAVRIERPATGRPEPDIIVYSRRRRAIRRASDRLRHLVDPRLDLANLSELTRSDVLHRIANMFAAATLRADLEHAVVFPRRIADQVALVNRLRERLLAVDVFTSLARQNRH